MTRLLPRCAALAGCALVATALAQPVAAPTLSGWAQMPPATLPDGPTSGRFAVPNPYGTNAPPCANRQPVQGFSGVLQGPGHDTFRFLVDNGFGARAHSADALLRLLEFDIASGAYTGQFYRYPLEAAGTAIGDMTAVDATRFIVIERNGGTATSAVAPFKKLFVIGRAGVPFGVPFGGPVAKTERLDLMAIADPDDLNGDGASIFTMPYGTIENVRVIDDHTRLVVNDNNFR